MRIQKREALEWALGVAAGAAIPFIVEYIFQVVGALIVGVLFLMGSGKVFGKKEEQ